MKKTVFPLTVLLLAVLFQGCSGTKPYPKQSNDNIAVTTKIDPGYVVSSMKAYMNVYKFDAACKENYLGTIQLDKERISSGVDVNEDMQFYVVFATSSFLSVFFPELNGSMGVPVNIKTRKGYTYEFGVVYKDDIYNVEVFEVNDSTKKRQKLDYENSTCQS